MKQQKGQQSSDVAIEQVRSMLATLPRRSAPLALRNHWGKNRNHESSKQIARKLRDEAGGTIAAAVAMGSVTHRIRVAGHEADYHCRDGDTLLRAALRAGVGLPYECNAGSCGSCNFELLSGSVDDAWPEAPGLGARDRQRGRRLACQSIPRADCTIKTRLADGCLARHAPERRQAVLREVRPVTHDIREFTFEAEGDALFQSGQYAMLRLPPLAQAQRAYSMSNTANASKLWKFMVRRTPSGAVSNALFEWPLTTSVELDGPFGLAFLREDAARDIVCIAGGSGLAPMISILDGASQAPQMQRLGAWLFYGGRSPADVPALSSLLAAHHVERGLQWHPVVSVPALADDIPWTGQTGFVHHLLPRKLPKPLTTYEYYLAGPPPMIKATVQLLVAAHGVPTAQLHYDRFF